MTDDQPSDALKPIAQAVPEALGQIVGATVGFTVGGPPGALAGAVVGPYLEAVTRATGRAWKNRQLKQAAVLEAACRHLNREPDDLVGDLEQDQATLELLARVLEAGGRSVMAPKLEALGQVLADGVQTGNLDYALALADALYALEVPHVRILSGIGRHADQPQHDEMAPTTGAVGWNPDRIRGRYPDIAKLVDPVLAILRLHGLIRDIAIGTWNSLEGQERYVITAIGTDCLRLLDASR